MENILYILTALPGSIAMVIATCLTSTGTTPSVTSTSTGLTTIGMTTGVSSPSASHHRHLDSCILETCFLDTWSLVSLPPAYFAGGLFYVIMYLESK